MEDSGCLGCDTASLGKWFVTYQRNLDFRVHEEFTLNLWRWSDKFLPNMRNYLPSDALLYFIRLESPITLQWEQCNVMNYDFYFCLFVGLFVNMSTAKVNIALMNDSQNQEEWLEQNECWWCFMRCQPNIWVQGHWKTTSNLNSDN